MRTFSSPLPIDEVLPLCRDRLHNHNALVIVAPPGAGKTTRVPLALLEEPWCKTGKILVLEPRRLAARGAAKHMADMLGEAVGDTIGYRVRLGSKISTKTRIEVITEGIFTRMILNQPALDDVAAVIFDEFHERSLDADLGLALALESQHAFRPDLRLIAMSATLDGARVAALMGQCPVIESEGRSYPIDTRYRPRDPAQRLEDAIPTLVNDVLAQETGSVLIFLPGQNEIRRLASRLTEIIKNPLVDVMPLYGAMDPAEQDRAIAPAQHGRRKIVLATSIAETSLTIEGVRVVIDSGLQRVPVYEPDLGLTRLETRRVSRASADQRRGRAGRTEPGICYRLWEEAATGALEAFSKPEILSADLSGFLLDCAAWGVSDPLTLPFLDPPSRPAVAEARALLIDLGAFDQDGQLTARGRLIRTFPLPPRLARMIVDASQFGATEEATMIAALIVERGIGGASIDITLRLDQFRNDRSARASDIKRLVQSWMRLVPDHAVTHASEISAGQILALAFPDRLAKARGQAGSFLMANGRAAAVESHDSLACAPYLAIAEIAGAAAGARILLAAPLTQVELEATFQNEITTETTLSFDKDAATLRAQKIKRYHALILSEQNLPVPATEEAAECLARGLASLGIERWPLSKATRQFRDRVMFLRAGDPSWPDLSDQALTQTASEWLAPYLIGKTGLDDLDTELFRTALESRFDWAAMQRLDAEAPSHFTAPTGTTHSIDYTAAEGAVLAIRVQELFGLKTHPSVAGGRIPLVLHLLSPAHRPLQITRDLPGFWKGSWAAVRSEMKGRYPKHVWPEDPATAAPTTRAKPRGT